ncbi:hypothetical protein QTP88_008353 [Uroleucon formosanum]
MGRTQFYKRLLSLAKICCKDVVRRKPCGSTDGPSVKGEGGLKGGLRASGLGRGACGAFRHQQHSVEELENASMIIASGKSIRSVSRDLNISFSVLQRFHKNRQQNPHFVPKKLGGQISLPESVEKALVENI